MKIFTTLLSLLFICTPLSSFAKSNNQYTQAKHNFETECVRGLAQPALLKNKVQNHTFQIKSSTDEFPILYGLETAQLGNGQSIRLEHVGCESYGFDVQLTLNASHIEKAQKLCQSCLIQDLRKLSVYFQAEDRQFYLEGIKALEQQYVKHKTFKVDTEYQLKGTEEMPQTFTFGKIAKQKNGQYVVSFLNRIGPL